MNKTASFRNFAGNIHDYARATGLTMSQLQSRSAKARKAKEALRAVIPYDFFKTREGLKYLAETTVGFDTDALSKLRKIGSMHKTAYYMGYIGKTALDLDINKGDILLGGRFKNKRMEVKDIGTDELGQPTVNGRKLLSFRIEKKLPKNKQSKITQEKLN